jgi:Na+ dependent nucleoside transporter C-terminus
LILCPVSHHAKRPRTQRPDGGIGTDEASDFVIVGLRSVNGGGGRRCGAAYYAVGRSRSLLTSGYVLSYVRIRNFGSLGIMIAGLSTMCPEKRDEVVSLGLKSIVSGTLTTCSLGAIVGVLS